MLSQKGDHGFYAQISASSGSRGSDEGNGLTLVKVALGISEHRYQKTQLAGQEPGDDSEIFHGCPPLDLRLLNGSEPFELSIHLGGSSPAPANLL
jgi:hypothetical protein